MPIPHERATPRIFFEGEAPTGSPAEITVTDVLPVPVGGKVIITDIRIFNYAAAARRVEIYKGPSGFTPDSTFVCHVRDLVDGTAGGYIPFDESTKKVVLEAGYQLYAVADGADLTLEVDGLYLEEAS